MSTTKQLLIFFSFVILASCANVKHYEHVPLTQGIFDEKVEKSPLNQVPTAPPSQVAIILSLNTKRSIGNQEAIVDHNDWMADSGIFIGRDNFIKAQREANDPRYEILYAVATLKKNFKNVIIVNNLESFYTSKSSTLVIVDIYRKIDNGFSAFDQTFKIRTNFYDGQLRYINGAAAEVVERIPHKGMGGSDDSYTLKVHDVVVKGLSLWEDRLAELLSTP